MINDLIPPLLGGIGGIIVVVIGEISSRFLTKSSVKREEQKRKYIAESVMLNPEFPIPITKIIPPIQLEKSYNFENNPPDAYIWKDNKEIL